jgi:hypothetical protein
MQRRRSFMLGLTRRRSTTLYLARRAKAPIPGPWTLTALVIA